ncbi:hypothetical protein BDB01DRAFT_851265 [Pilobolus umbonatus]|nr:hypothetical protein BDB01DRAFT_851265 [Pilobolus umbonatus]
MTTHQKKPSIQPRQTKASLLRTQKPASAPVSTTTPLTTTTKKTEAPIKKVEERPSSRAKVVNDTGPSEGVKAFMAKKRAMLSNRKTEAPTETIQHKAGRQPAVSDAPQTMRKIQIVIKQAKGSGKLDISNRQIDKIPEEVLTMYHSNPSSGIIDFASTGASWYDEEELTRFIATDNVITQIDERIGSEFGGLKQINFRNNLLSDLPQSLLLCRNLTSVLLSYNKIKEFPSFLLELGQLKEIDLSHNMIDAIDYDGSPLIIETLDLSYNHLTHISPTFLSSLARIRRMNISHNQIKYFHFNSWMYLEELQLKDNQLKRLISSDGDIQLPLLKRMNASNNVIQSITEHDVSMPQLIELMLSNNELSEDGFNMPVTPIQTLDLSSNHLNDIPDSVTDLFQLERLDIRNNYLKALPYKLGKLDQLKMIQYEGNPIRSPNTNMSLLIKSLQHNYQTFIQDSQKSEEQDQEEAIEALDHFMRNINLNKKLDLSRKGLTELKKEDVMMNDEETAGIIVLDRNELSLFPSLGLYSYSSFLVQLSLENNKITTFDLKMGVIFHQLKILNLSNNRLRSIGSDDEESSFPQLRELILSHNQLTQIPNLLCLPLLRKLDMASNRLQAIPVEWLPKQLEILDISNNAINHLSPELATMTLKELVVYGNMFRVPRPNVVEQGTPAIMEFLRRRLGQL